MPPTRYSIPDFITDAKKVLASREALAVRKAAIGEHLRELAKRDDLLRFGRPIGHADASNFNWILHREAPDMMLIMSAWLPGFRSPVHEHGDFYVVAVGYQGHDQWDIYERLDDRRTPGHAELKLIDQWDVKPGQVVCMLPPPRSIHAHNNVAPGQVTYELLFTATPPLPPEERLLFDVERNVCWPSPQTWDGFSGDWPPRAAAAQGISMSVGRSLTQLKRQFFCPLCDCVQRFMFPRADKPQPALARLSRL